MKKVNQTEDGAIRFPRRNFAWLGAALLAFALATPLLAESERGKDKGDDQSENRGQGQRYASVLPASSRPYGLTYGEWQARWWQWSISIPYDIHPYVGEQFADANQSGHVWFLVGYNDGAVRHVTIPRGKAIFFPVVNVECSNVEPAGFFGADEAAMRLCVREFVRTDMQCFIDGLPVRNLDRFEGESPLFGFDAPDKNILTGGDAVSGESVSAGTYVMLPPLSVGHHTIRFKGTQTDPIFGSFTFESNYEVTVNSAAH